MTACTICAAPIPGTDDASEACCAWCHALNLAGAELRPPVWLRRDLPRPWDEDARALPAVLRALVEGGDEREA